MVTILLTSVHDTVYWIDKHSNCGLLSIYLPGQGSSIGCSLLILMQSDLCYTLSYIIVLEMKMTSIHKFTKLVSFVFSSPS